MSFPASPNSVFIFASPIIVSPVALFEPVIFSILDKLSISVTPISTLLLSKIALIADVAFV